MSKSYRPRQKNVDPPSTRSRSSVSMPCRVSTAVCSSPKSSPTIPTTRTCVKKLAASEKWVAEPPSMRSRSPNGVATESNATEPTTTSDIRRYRATPGGETSFREGHRNRPITPTRGPNGRSTYRQDHRILRRQRGRRAGRGHDSLGAPEGRGCDGRDGVAGAGSDPDDGPPRQVRHLSGRQGGQAGRAGPLRRTGAA